MTTDYIGQKPTFTALPNWLRGQATPMEGWVLWCLQSHFPNIHPSLNLLAKEACMSRRAVCTVLAGIERKGWLVREQSFSETGRQTATRYRLTIWDPHWAVEEGASGALVQEVHSRRGAGDAPSGVHDVHGGSAGGALKEDQEKKNKKKKTYEPPLPPTARGERRPEAVAAPPCRDRDGFLIPDPEPQPAEPPAAVQPQPQQPHAPKPLPEPAPDPEAIVPVKPKARKREAGFVPAHEDVPAALLPVVRELLAFWPARNPKGKRTQQAWKGMLTEARKIQDHPQGGTEILREQLEEGVKAKIRGVGWIGLDFSRWQQYGTKAGTPVMGSGFKRRLTPEESAAEAIAYIRARDAKAAAATTTKQAVLVEVLA